MPESEAYEECKAAQVPANERIKLILATMWANRWKLAGTAGSWFILVREGATTNGLPGWLPV